MAHIRALALVVLLLIWQQVAAQDAENNFVIPTGRTTYEVTAGRPLTVEWTNPSSSTVTIKLQQEPLTPDSGIILAAGIPASALTATLTVPTAEDLNSSLYVLKIFDDIDPNNYNLSPNFSIDLGTGSASSATSETLVTPTTTETSTTPITTSTADQTGTSESSGTSPSLSTAFVVPVAISGAVGVFVLVALVFFLMRQRRKGKKLWATALTAIETAPTSGLGFTVETAPRSLWP